MKLSPNVINDRRVYLALPDVDGVLWVESQDDVGSSLQLESTQNSWDTGDLESDL